MLTLSPKELRELAELPRHTGLNAGLRAWQAERREIREEGERLFAEATASWKRGAPERDRAAVTARNAKRRASERHRMPAWADRDAIAEVYREARRVTLETGVPHQVDHDYPLHGRLVSGLHVHGNLRIITAADNCRKHNRFEVE